MPREPPRAPATGSLLRFPCQSLSALAAMRLHPALGYVLATRAGGDDLLFPIVVGVVNLDRHRLEQDRGQIVRRDAEHLIRRLVKGDAAALNLVQRRRRLFADDVLEVPAAHVAHFRRGFVGDLSFTADF